MATIQIKEITLTIDDNQLSQLLAKLFPVVNALSADTTAAATSLKEVAPAPEAVTSVNASDTLTDYYSPMLDTELVALVNKAFTPKSNAFLTGKNAILFLRKVLDINYTPTSESFAVKRIQETKSTLEAMDELFFFIESNNARKYLSPGIAVGVFKVLDSLEATPKKSAVFNIKSAMQHALTETKVSKEVEAISKIFKKAVSLTTLPQAHRYYVATHLVSNELIIALEKSNYITRKVTI